MTGRAIILTGCAVAIAAGAGIWLWGIDRPETKPDAITAVSVDEGGEQRAQPRETAVETLSEPSAPEPSAPEPVPTEDLALATPADDPAPVPAQVPSNGGETDASVTEESSAEDTPAAPASIPQSEDTPEDLAENTAEPADAPAEGAFTLATDPPEADAPEFDIVRIDRSGNAVIAGRAEPGSDVEIVLDGEVVATETADQSGSFVSLVALKASGEARRLSLRTARGGAERQTIAGAEPSVRDLPGQLPAAPEGPADDVLAANASAGSVVERPDAPAQTAPADARFSDAASLVDPIFSTTPGDLAAANTADTGPRLATEAEAPVAPAADAPASLAARGLDSSRPSPDTVAAGLGRAPDNAVTPRGGEEILILPSGSGDEAPVLLRSSGEDIALIQPAPSEALGVQLDRITYEDGGNVDLEGRAKTGNRIRVYANAELVGEADVVPPGVWQAELGVVRAQAAQLLRFDELDSSGKVVSRIETPFSYSTDGTAQTLTQRAVEIERGDYLWRIAERYYGEGIRYSLIFSANSDLIRDPDLIYPGQVFTVPELVPSE